MRYLQGDKCLHLSECGSEEDIFAFLITPFNSCLLGNDAPRALGGKVFQMKNSVIRLALM